VKKISMLIALLFAFNVCGQDSKEQDNLDKLFELMNMDSMINTMYDQMGAMFSDFEQDVEMSSEEAALRDKHRKQQTNIMKTEMSWDAMKVDLKQVYRQNFTENEIADMLVFYKSPTGQSVLRTMPVVMQESMQISQVMAQKMIPKLQELFKRQMQEIKELRESSK